MPRWGASSSQSGLIEQWGSGIPRMVEEAKKLGLPEPELLEIGMRVRCIVRFAEEFGASVPEPPRAESGLESELESGLESGLESALLNELRDGPLSCSEIAQRLGHKRISGVVDRLIRRLMISGRIVQTLPEKPNSRLQKYRKV